MSCCRISTKICAEHCNKIFGEEITLDVFISVMGSKYMILMLHEEKERQMSLQCLYGLE